MTWVKMMYLQRPGGEGHDTRHLSIQVVGHVRRLALVYTIKQIDW
jgi:hypothetical protein